MVVKVDSFEEAEAIGNMIARNTELEAENAAKDARIAELGDALRPFAEMAENIGECAEDDEVLYPFVESANHMLTVRDARKARALLPATGKESDR